ncbi:hypothetical protein K8T06_10275 [bacterium]|nr:hypothetical protein [bacterium]
MSRLSIVLVIICSFVTGMSLACETEQYLDGYKWTFHRMDDGNKYHEVKNLGEFTEGDTLSLTAPCKGNHIDTIQIDWEDDHSEVKGELVVIPGNQRYGSRDISGKQRVSWTVQKNMNRFRIEFSGQRGHRCRIRFIRVFYGQNSGGLLQQQGSNPGNRRHKLIDRISLTDGAVKRKARVIRWDGTHLHVAVKKQNGQKILKLAPARIKNLFMADRWGQAIAKDGSRFPVRINQMNGAMIKFDKKLNGQVVPKPLTNIHNFTSITFGK